ncbi:MAG: hypothetical protein OXF93_19990 [Acidobacteria bacterium]|nr:hypothetical protein [Acidobacteriota bacterium]
MRRHTTFVVALATALCFGGPSAAEPPPAEHRVLAQEGAPVTIFQYSARYQRQGFGSQREGIRHELNYRNTSNRKIVAFRFGLLAFSIFNEFQHSLNGFAIEDLDAGAVDSGTWLATFARAEAAFYTGVAYVEKVRFEDGEIWTANGDEIQDQLQELEGDFSMEALDP